MLDATSLKRLFSAARAKGFGSCSLYAEVSAETIWEAGGKIVDSREGLSGGVSLLCHSDERSLTLTSHGFDTDSLLAKLEGKEVPSAVARNDFLLDCLARKYQLPSRSPERVKAALARWLRERSQGEFLVPPTLAYRERVRFYEIVHSDGNQGRGQEETSSLVSWWTLDRAGRSRRFREERLRASLAAGLAELESPRLFVEEIERSRHATRLWPAPSGEMPVHWSSRAVARILHQWLRAFEGDRVLNQLSFMNEVDLPLPLPFSVIDRPEVGDDSCDHEGSPRRVVTLFHEGKPRSLACNRAIARQLEVPSTGHCRRESFRDAPTVGFWRPEMVPLCGEADLLSSLAWGLSVRDVSVLRFDPASPRMKLRLEDVRLVHQGAEGDRVEPVEMETDILSLLSSFSAFGNRAEPFGLRTPKGPQAVPVELVTPPAVSERIPIPGSVPKAQYWEL